MLDFDWMINTLKEAIEEEDWELVREVIAYLKADDVFEDYRQEEDWFKGADDNELYGAVMEIDRCYLTIECSRD